MGKNKYLKRESYLKKLTIRQYYGEVKIITCSCRCGNHDFLVTDAWIICWNKECFPAISLCLTFIETMTNMIRHI